MRDEGEENKFMQLVTALSKNMLHQRYSVLGRSHSRAMACIFPHVDLINDSMAVLQSRHPTLSVHFSVWMFSSSLSLLVDLALNIRWTPPAPTA